MDRVKEATYGRWFARDPTKPEGYTWVQETAANPGVDPLDQDGDGRLDALVGHANFVAGVVAQACPTATLEVVSHNGAFVNSDDADTPIPTEASVALSLWEVCTRTSTERDQRRVRVSDAPCSACRAADRRRRAAELDVLGSRSTRSTTGLQP